MLFLVKVAAYVWFFTIVALARHARAALASQIFVPRPIGVVLADPSYAEADRTMLIHIPS